MKKSVIRGMALSASAAALVGGLGLSVPAAFADAPGDLSGCTGSNLVSDPVMLCTGIKGHSTQVNNIQSSIDIKNYTCNAKFKVWGTYANGKKYSDTGRAKCGAGRVWVNFKPAHKHFKSGTKVCSGLIEDGKVRREHACLEIKK